MNTEKLQQLIILCDQAMAHCRQNINGSVFMEGWIRPKPLNPKDRREAGIDAYNEIQKVRMILQEELIQSVDAAQKRTAVT